ncbi:DUF192 domain-containing protein [Candidatus Woesearchaeota archaeon]|nr:DUF192 domain-containing protein [Candidatus Woesearchaeota archaeon]
MKFQLLILMLLILVSCTNIKKICFKNNICIDAEVKDSPEEREQGLMYRKTLEENKGMLFVFEEPDEYGFWMKNMNFPIDIIWLNEDKRIIHIEKDLAPCKSESCEVYYPDNDSLYVIEVVANFTEKNHINKGDLIYFKLS